MVGGEPANGGRVTNKDLFDAIKEQSKERADLERRIMGKMDDICDSVSRHDERIKVNKEEIVGLRKKSDAWNAGNTLGLMVTAALSALGIHQAGG